jgi:hypothetical protein
MARPLPVALASGGIKGPAGAGRRPAEPRKSDAPARSRPVRIGESVTLRLAAWQVLAACQVLAARAGPAAAAQAQLEVGAFLFSMGYLQKRNHRARRPGAGAAAPGRAGPGRSQQGGLWPARLF